MVEVRVNGLFMTQSQASGIILKEQNGERALPIVIGEYEAQSIALALENLIFSSIASYQVFMMCFGSSYSIS